MFCIYCGAKIPDDSLFCEKCGKRVAPAHKAEHAAQTSAPNEEAARKRPAPPQAEPFRQAGPAPQAEPASQPAPEKDRLRKPRPSSALLRHTVAAVLVLASPLAFFGYIFGVYHNWRAYSNSFWGRRGLHLTISAAVLCCLLAIAAVLLFRARKTLSRKKLAMLWGGIAAAGLIILYILYNALRVGSAWLVEDLLLSLFVYCLILTAVGAALLWWESRGKK